MKLKAVLHDRCSKSLISALEGLQFREKVFERVLRRHLRFSENCGPAEFYIQNCDFACSEEAMCEVRLTGVSVNTRRSTEDFRNALQELEAVYKEEITLHCRQGEKYQLFVSMMLDQCPFGESSPLMERMPIFVPSLASS